MTQGFKDGRGNFRPTTKNKVRKKNHFEKKSLKPDGLMLPFRPNGKVIFVKTRKQQAELIKKEKAKGRDVMKIPPQVFFEDGHEFFGVATY